MSNPHLLMENLNSQLIKNDYSNFHWFIERKLYWQLQKQLSGPDRIIGHAARTCHH